MRRDFNEDLATFVFFFIQFSSFKINEFVSSQSTNECVLIRGFHFISYAYHSEMKGQLPLKQVLVLSFLRQWQSVGLISMSFRPNTTMTKRKLSSLIWSDVYFQKTACSGASVCRTSIWFSALYSKCYTFTKRSSMLNCEVVKTGAKL